MNPVLSIIIVSYNTGKITIDCLKSIFKDKGLEFDLSHPKDDHKIPTEIIVIDNASSDNSVQTLKDVRARRASSNFKIVQNKRNAGFARANNQAIKLTKGNYILFLNSDTLILHSAISQSLNWLSAHPQTSVCTAQLLNKNKTIQASGGFFPNLLNTLTWSIGLDDLPLVNKIISPIHPHTPQFYTRDNFYKKDHQQDWVTGAFMLIKKEAINQTKGFDENYFMYAEELEWCYRIKKSDPKTQIWYLIGPQIIHLGGASATHHSHKLINEYKGILAFFKKHKKNQYKLVRIFLKLNCLLRSIIKPNYRNLCSKI
ncbi:glycosyltransferase family 2 protein [Patescibacteria group bacterium]|nr:glycosyltransferase family 2 protein [Patescibacteria group bacterium]